jgi:hypothetical protein
MLVRAKKKPREISGLFEFKKRKSGASKTRPQLDIYRDPIGHATTVNHLLTNRRLTIPYERHE